MLQLFLVSIFLLLPGLSQATPKITPTPQYMEAVPRALKLSREDRVAIHVGPSTAVDQEKMALAADYLRRGLVDAVPNMRIDVERFNSKPLGPRFVLWKWDQESNVPISLNFLDRQVLSAPEYHQQGYVIRFTDSDGTWVVGSSAQAVLYGVMSLLQLVEPTAKGAELPAVYVRDYPDFRFRAASDWLLRIEIDRWALDRGKGLEAFIRLFEKKLDRALRFKINMVIADGFGFGLGGRRFPQYGASMRRLNSYARKRGISLMHLGYGAGYDIAARTGEYMGQAFENRERYPDGPVYECMASSYSPTGARVITGTCRSNEQMNRLKADELRRFVETVEPGALYIHHEDFGDFQSTENSWKRRCQQCRRRWPTDALAARDGGAGGLAHGYASLVEAVNSVNNPATGYKASRDCQIILISPVYLPDAPDPADWSETLELWRNIALELPRSGNVQFGFREVLPQKQGGEKWTEVFQQVMKKEGSPAGMFLFFAGGADGFRSDFPLTGTPALNAMFTGATTLYNASGDSYQEPMEVINAEYTWNVRSRGHFRDPRRYSEAEELLYRYIYEEDQPTEIFGAGGIYETACELLYGPSAGKVMKDYYRESYWIPEVEKAPVQVSDPKAYRGYVPNVWNRAYAASPHWRHLQLDSESWKCEVNIKSEPSRAEHHRRRARRWRILSELNSKGARYITRALGANPKPDSVEDLQFLLKRFAVYTPLLKALATYHEGLALQCSDPVKASGAKDLFEQALTTAQEAERMAARSFPQPVDPIGSEVGAIRTYSQKLVAAIQTARQAQRPVR